MQERRKTHRGRTYLGSTIAFNNRCSTIDCMVRNMSQNGAKLVFAHPVTCPDEFDLMIPQKGDSRRVRIVWRQEMEAGVVFLASNVGTVVSIETARRMRALEAERASLARRVATLSEPA
ncbi:MAG: PilZ domain-containing protein [Beijerinckiaceae bacterium]|nr:PilZ domain-containing protein [Beijerinckiaceae bacterium]